MDPNAQCNGELQISVGVHANFGGFRIPAVGGWGITITNPMLILDRVQSLSTSLFGPWRFPVCLPMPTTTSTIISTITSTTASTTALSSGGPLMWSVTSGSCRIVRRTNPNYPESQSCAASPNYPDNYDNADSCEIEVNADVASPLEVVRFDTEEVHDVLTVNGMAYHGTNGPELVTPTAAITWSADGTMSRRGWLLCKTTTSSTSTDYYNDYYYNYHSTSTSTRPAYESMNRISRMAASHSTRASLRPTAASITALFVIGFAPC